jgi:hypothetical protein
MPGGAHFFAIRATRVTCARVHYLLRQAGPFNKVPGWKCEEIGLRAQGEAVRCRLGRSTFSFLFIADGP